MEDHLNTKLEAVTFAFPDVAGKNVLVLGLGGGCDIITAFAVSWLTNAFVFEPGIVPAKSQ